MHNSRNDKTIKNGLDILYPAGYNMCEIVVKETEIFKRWIKALKDRTARSIINARIRRLSLGNKGDTEFVGDCISELRVDYGPGYRVYYKQVQNCIVILLCGGDKSSQKRDIEKAKQIAKNLEVSE